MKIARRAIVLALAGLAVPASAFAHARVTPSVTLAKQLELYSLVVPTEKEGVTTTKIVLTVPAGFAIDSFVAAPGWKRQLQQTGSGDNAVVQSVTWTGGHVPTEEDAFFQFLAQAQSAKTYTFGVQQAYSDGSVVDWNGSESSDTPAPTIEAKSSLAGGGSSTLALIALVVGGFAVLLGIVGLAGRFGGGAGGGGAGRQLA